MVLSGNSISLGANTIVNPGGYFQGFEPFCYDSGYYTTGYNSSGTAQISFSDVPVVKTATGGSTPINVQISNLYGATYTTGSQGTQGTQGIQGTQGTGGGSTVDNLTLTLQQSFGGGGGIDETYLGDWASGNGAVALSSNGNILISSDTNETYSGATITGIIIADSFNISYNAWPITYATLIYNPTGATGTQIGFGDSLAMSSDSYTIAVGAPFNDEDYRVAANGAVWVYYRSPDSNQYTQQAGPLIDSSVINGYQGTAVSLCANGSILAISGALNFDTDSPVWIWTRSGTTWTMQKKITVTGETGVAGFGFSISLSRDGSTLAVGGPSNNNGIGAVWIFINNSGTWTQQAMLVGTGNIGAAGQGYSVSLSANGNVLAVGGPSDGGGFTGKTWIWNRSGTTWTQVTILVGTPNYYNSSIPYYPQQGTSVSLSNTGNLLAVTGGNQNYEGQFYIFKFIGAYWVQTHTTNFGGNGLFRPTVACLSDDGNRLAVLDHGGFLNPLGNGYGGVAVYT
jgi:hypothetical protein